MDEDLEKYLDAKFDGVHERFDTIDKTVDRHDKSLYGDDGRGGIVKDIGAIKTIGGTLSFIFTSLIGWMGISK